MGTKSLTSPAPFPAVRPNKQNEPEKQMMPERSIAYLPASPLQLNTLGQGCVRVSWFCPHLNQLWHLKHISTREFQAL